MNFLGWNTILSYAGYYFYLFINRTVNRCNNKHFKQLFYATLSSHYLIELHECHPVLNKIIILCTYTVQQYKLWGLYKVSYAHQGCIYLIKNTLKNVHC